MSAPLIRTDDPGPCPPVGTVLMGRADSLWRVDRPGELTLVSGGGTTHYWRTVNRVLGPLTEVLGGAR